MTSMRDVARHANVSPGTVSQLLSGRARVGTETAQRIHAAMGALGYEPKRPGRPRARHKLYHFGFLLGSSADTMGPESQFADLPRRRLTAVRESVSESGDQLSIFPGDCPVDENWAFRDAVDSGHVHGAIYLDHHAEHGYIEWCAARGVPVVVIDRTAPHHEFSSVGIHPTRGGQRAAEHLIGLGHRRLGLIDRTYARHSALEQRLAGFRAAADDAESVDEWALTPNITDEQVTALCAQIHERGVTGVFVPGHPQALMLLAGFERLGVPVPGELSVVAFDDIDQRSEGGLRPTAVGYDDRCLGRCVVRVLRQLLEEPEVAHCCTLIEPSIARHDTTAPPPAPRRA